MRIPLTKLSLSLVVAVAVVGLTFAEVNSVAEKVIYDSMSQSTVAAKKPIEPKIPDALLRVAFCESGNMQFYPDGTLVTGPDGHDHGRFQIRETVHRAAAAKRGWDIDTDYGNTMYALYLYKHSGLGPWYSSSSCWSSLSELRKKGYQG